MIATASFPGLPRVESGLRLRRLLAIEGPFAWWDALVVASGVRCVALDVSRREQVGVEAADVVLAAPPFAAFAPGWLISPPVEAYLDEWLPSPGEAGFYDDDVLAARLAVALVQAASGCVAITKDEAVFDALAGVCASPDVGASAGVGPSSAVGASAGPEEWAAEADSRVSNLASRLFLVNDRWHLCGLRWGGEAALLLALFAPSDAAQLQGWFLDGANARLPAPLIRAWATYLAGERHVLVRRTSRDVIAHVASQLLAVASRLWRAFPPPPADGAGVVSAGGRVRLVSGEVVFGGGRLEVRPARVAIRALSEAHNPALFPLLRWLRAMTTLRVERELLRRR